MALTPFWKHLLRRMMALRLVVVPSDCYSGDAGGGSGNVPCYLPQCARFFNERHTYTLYFDMPETAQWLGHFLTSMWLMHASHIPELLFTKIYISAPSFLSQTLLGCIPQLLHSSSALRPAPLGRGVLIGHSYRCRQRSKRGLIE